MTSSRTSSSAFIDDLKAAEKMGLYLNVQEMKMLPKAAMDVFDTAAFTFDVKAGGCKSYILLNARNNQFVKVRITQFVVNNRTNDMEMNAFLSALAEKMTAAKK